jgi:hypothetical protein
MNGEGKGNFLSTTDFSLKVQSYHPDSFANPAASSGECLFAIGFAFRRAARALTTSVHGTARTSGFSTRAYPFCALPAYC